MLSRGVRLFLSLAVLAATGVVSSAPCCAMERLSGPASVEVRDCCDGSDCCRLEKGGLAQAVLSIKPPEVRTAAALPFSHPAPLGEAAFASRARLAQLSLLETDHSPPRDGRDTHRRISLLRI
jgi:hypothetical protein